MVLLPDVEALLAAHLRAHPLMAGASVATLRPADLHPLPLVVLTRIGGTAVGLARSSLLLDRAGIAVQCWASSQAAANAIARRALAALWESRGPHDGGTITHISLLGGLAEQPDPGAPDGVHRYGFTAQVTSHR